MRGWFLVALLGGLLGGLGCASPVSTEPAPSYQEVEDLFAATCAFASCHGGRGPGAADLNFERAIEDGVPLTDLLVDRRACGYDAWDRVRPGAPDESWLMVKIEGPADETGRLLFEPDPNWVPAPESCAVEMAPGRYDFGHQMPLGGSLTAEEVALVRAWIEHGAPGPAPSAQLTAAD